MIFPLYLNQYFCYKVNGPANGQLQSMSRNVWWSWSRKQLVENFCDTNGVFYPTTSHLPPPPPMVPALHQTPRFTDTIHIAQESNRELNFFSVVVFFFFFEHPGHCILWSFYELKISPNLSFLEVKKINKTVMHGNAPLEGWRFSFRGSCGWIHKEVKPDKIKQ